MNDLRAEVGRAVSCVAVSCSCGSFLATPTLADLFHPLYLYLYLSKLVPKSMGSQNCVTAVSVILSVVSI